MACKFSSCASDDDDVENENDHADDDGQANYKGNTRKMESKLT